MTSILRDGLSRLFFLLDRAFRRSKENHCLNAMRQWQWMSSAEVAALRMGRLKTLLKFASQTRYYQEIFSQRNIQTRDIRSFEDLSALPVLTKNDLQDHLADLLNPGVRPQDRFRSQSGGSTGIPTVFYHDRQFWHWFYGASWLGYEWCGYRPGDRQTYLWGADFDCPPDTLFSKLKQYLTNSYFENAFRMSDESLRGFAHRLLDWHPDFMWSYVSSSVLLARFVRDHELNIRLKAIRTTAETLTVDQRQFLTSTFGCPVFNQYGSRELGMIAQECERHEGLHVFSPNQYVELIPILGTDLGRLVITNLTNQAMPFIRYETGDLGRWIQGACACGRTWPRLESVVGRISDILVTPSGRWIHGEFFTHLFYELDSVRQFQVIQEMRDQLLVRIVFKDVGQSIREKSLRFLTKKIHEHGDKDFKIQFDIVEKIEPSPSGKFRFTMSRLPFVS